jgi:hypothetical protein
MTQPVQIDAGYDHVCALANEGMLCWGDNTYNQISVPDLGFDADGDGIANDVDSCRLAAGWSDIDSDAICDADDLDFDNDGFPDTFDWDDDGDGVPDTVDAAPLDAGNSNEVTLPLDGAYRGLLRRD